MLCDTFVPVVNFNIWFCFITVFRFQDYKNMSLSFINSSEMAIVNSHFTGNRRFTGLFHQLLNLVNRHNYYKKTNFFNAIRCYQHS